MKISQIYNLGKSQAELDFIDIDISRDTPLFLDPFFLSLRSDKFSITSNLTLRSFFQKVIDLIRSGKNQDARHLFDYFGEENSTCLGLSSGAPEGKGPGNKDSTKIFNNLLNSKAIQTGLVQDIEDNILFIDNFGKDKLSDMTTKIIKRHLLDYTIDQCKLHNIPVTANVVSGFYWSKEREIWITEYTSALVIDEKLILLVPKGIVSYSESYTPQRYYRHFILNFLQNEHLNLNSSLVQQQKNGSTFVTKKDIEELNPESKQFLRDFTTKHPELLQKFKEETIIHPLKNNEITDISMKQICKFLGEQLVNIPVGAEEASKFHSTTLGILEVLFYPNLIYPVKEREIHDGRKRIDITFDNASKTGIFNRLPENMHLPCPYLLFECKNYTADPANPELDQLGGRFSMTRGKVGFLICRRFTNRELFIKRCQDTYKDGRGLIVPLVDQDIVTLLDFHNENDFSFIDNYLSTLIREIAIN